VKSCQPHKEKKREEKNKQNEWHRKNLFMPVKFLVGSRLPGAKLASNGTWQLEGGLKPSSRGSLWSDSLAEH